MKKEISFTVLCGTNLNTHLSSDFSSWQNWFPNKALCGDGKYTAPGFSFSTPASRQVQLTNPSTSSCWAPIPRGTLNTVLQAAATSELELTHKLNLYLPDLE